MELMARYPDKYFSIAIIDPPYGILNKTKAPPEDGQSFSIPPFLM